MRGRVTRANAAASIVWLLCAGAAVASFSAGLSGAAGPAPSQDPRAPAQRGGGAPGQPPPPPQKGNGLVLGQVVDAGTGRPIPEAVVSVTSRIPVASLQPAPGSNGPMRFITGSDGRFVLHDLPKTNLIVNVTATGYIQGSPGQARPNGLSHPIELDEGQRLSDVKIRLWKFGVLSGIVIDESGEPAVGVSVRTLRRSLSAGKPGYTPSGSATTDDRGMYRISALVPGEYVVAIPQTVTAIPAAIVDSFLQQITSGMPQGGGLADLALSGGGPSPGGMGVRIGNLLVGSTSGVIPSPGADGRVYAYQTMFFPSAGVSSQATVIVVKSGEERSGLDLQLKVIQTARVTGTVTGPTGPASGVGVRLTPVDVDELGGDSGFDAANTSTISDGTFTLLGVPPGQYIARVVKQPRPDMPAELADNPMMQLAFGGGGRGAGPNVALYGQAGVAVAGTDVTNVAISLSEGAKVSGRITFDGSIAAPTPQQMQTFTVGLTAAVGGGSGGVFSTPGRAGQDGQFKTAGYPGGKYVLNPTGRGAGWVLRSAMAGGRDVLNQPFELRDADVTDVLVTFTDKITQVNGTVQFPPAPSGSMPPTATVILFPADYRTWIGQGMNARRTRSSIVQKSGAFTLGNLAPGEYLLAALNDADVPENQDGAFFEAIAPSATRVVLQEGDKPSQTLSLVKVKK